MITNKKENKMAQIKNGKTVVKISKEQASALWLALKNRESINQLFCSNSPALRPTSKQVIAADSTLRKLGRKILGKGFDQYSNRHNPIGYRNLHSSMIKDETLDNFVKSLPSMIKGQ
jgi:hypothetical protein